MAAEYKPTVEQIIAQREPQYGNYAERCRVEQNLKRAMHDSRNWDSLNDAQRSALEMNAVKVSRILNGNPDNPDSWDDIGGYAKLAVQGNDAGAGQIVDMENSD